MFFFLLFFFWGGGAQQETDFSFQYSNLCRLAPQLTDVSSQRSEKSFNLRTDISGGGRGEGRGREGYSTDAQVGRCVTL